MSLLCRPLSNFLRFFCLSFVLLFFGKILNIFNFHAVEDRDEQIKIILLIKLNAQIQPSILIFH